MKTHMKRCTGYEYISSGEHAVRSVLDDMKISFDRQMKFQDCKDVRMLPFDFYIPQYNSAIEFDGQQHFKPVKLFGGVKAFKTTQHHDAIKTTYCVTKGIRLLRIKYTEFEQIQELITNFLTTDLDIHRVGQPIAISQNMALDTPKYEFTAAEQLILTKLDLINAKLDALISDVQNRLDTIANHIVVSI
jgi:very-short-patch-repair endonuclease